MPAIAEAAIQIVPDFDRFGRELDTGLKRSLKSAGSKINSIMRMATQATAALGGALTIVGAQSLKTSAELERSMQMIEGLVGIFDPAQLNSFRDAIARIAPATGESATELGKAMFFITSAGARGSTAIEILESTARLGAAGLGDLSEIAKGVVSAVNAYGEENITAAEAADMFANTVRLGNLEAQSLAPVLGHVIPIASQMGVTFDQVGGAIAGMTRLGQSAAESATALRATMSQLLKPTGRAGEALESVGLSSEQLRNALASGELDLLEVLTLVKTAFEGNTSAMAEAFPNLRALRGVLALVGSNYEDNRMIMDAMKDSTGVANEAFDAQADTLQFKLNQMLSAYKTLLIGVGDALKPFVIPIIENLTTKLQEQQGTLPDLITKMGLYLQLLTGKIDFSDFVQGMTEAFGHFSTEQSKLAKGYMVFKGQFDIVNEELKKSFTILTTAFIDNFGDLFPAFEGFNFTVTDVTNAIVFAIKKTTEFLSSTAFPKIREFIDFSKDAFESFRPTLQRYMDFFKYVFDEVRRTVNLFVENFRIIWDKYGERITAIATFIGENVIRTFKGIFDTVMGLVKMFIALFSGDFDTFKEGFIQAVTGLKDVVVALFERLAAGIILAISTLFVTVKNLIKFAFEGILNIFVYSLDWLVTKVQDFGSFVVEKFNELKDGSINIFNNLKQYFPIWWQDIKDFFAKGFNWLNEKLAIFGRFFVDQGFQAKVLAPVINKLSEWWENIKDFFKKGYDWIIEKTSMFGTWIVTNGFGKWIASVIDKVKVFWDNLKSKFQEFLGGDGFLATFVRSGLEGLKFIFDNTLGRIFNAVKAIFNSIKTFIYDWINSGFGSAIDNLFNSIKNRIASGINKMIGVLNGIIDKYNSIALVPDIPHVPSVNFGGMQDGGVVGRGGLAVIGEAGPELVNIPTGASVTPLPSVGSGLLPSDQKLLALANKMVNVVIELDSETIARKTAPIMVDTIRLKQGITIV